MPTDFEKIVFDPKSHTYKYGTQNLMPVTSVLKWFTPEFDSETALSAKAYETGRSKADIQAEWDAKRDQGLERGTRVHAYAEMVINGEELDMFLALNEHTHEMKQFDNAWAKLKDCYKATVHKQEWTVGDAEFGIAGRCDAILNMTDRDGKDKLCMFDWKTGKYTTRKYARESMLAPFDDLPCCEEVKYSMQVSLYRLIIRRNTDLDIRNGVILHLPKDFDYQFYHTIDLTDRLEHWLSKAKKEGTFGDPELERLAHKAAKPLDAFDNKNLTMLSPNSRKLLLHKAADLVRRGRKWLIEDK